MKESDIERILDEMSKMHRFVRRISYLIYKQYLKLTMVSSSVVHSAHRVLD